MQDFSIKIVDRDSAVIVRIVGDADVSHIDALRAALAAVLTARPPRVVLDLSDLTFINSLTLGVLVQFRHDATAAGSTLRLAGAKERVTDVLRKTRLVELFPLYDNPDHALQ